MRTEQERVLIAAQTLSAWKWVLESPTRRRKWDESLTRITSSEVADITGVPLDVVEAAIKNVGQEVANVG